MRFIFTLMDELTAHEIQRWRYPEPYAVYNMAADDHDPPAELLDQRSPYYAARDEQGKLVGFFTFGTSALVEGEHTPSLYINDQTLPIGLGMHPNLAGQGYGLAFVQAGLDFARREFLPHYFLLYVYSWNERAIRVYERAGFKRVRVISVRNRHGQSEFLQMEMPA
ncbi:MAG: GNAT family N-acetyltransferase [Ktedonobacteraceae bacterium]|nr:GNAT family N-acetyltransferase [Ktedonobacteraceae bacterium]